RGVVERSGMLLAELELNLKTPVMRHAHEVVRAQPVPDESLARFDSIEADGRAKIQVLRQHVEIRSHLQGPSARTGRYVVGLARRDLLACHSFIGDLPARHGYLHARHQMGALTQMLDQRVGIIARVERRRARREVRYPYFIKVLSCVHSVPLMKAQTQAR